MSRSDEAGAAMLDRRSLFRAALGLGAAGLAVALSACSAGHDRGSSSDEETMSGDVPARASDRDERVLVAFFSRAGENYYYGGRTDLEVGNTEVVARMIEKRLGCDVCTIQGTVPYSDDYDDTVQRNVREQDADARPAIAGDLPDLSTYDVVLLGSPIWNVRPPMIMKTFAEGLDFTGKRVHPFVTYAVSGLGTAERDYREACPGATLGEALAVQGERAAAAAPDVDAWLTRIGL